MIYRVDSDNWRLDESYKERNLYYKIFAGYLFNELIHGYEDRKNHFLELIRDTISKQDRFIGNREEALHVIGEIQQASLRVTLIITQLKLKRVRLKTEVKCLIF
jgi:hypothetical protein